MVKKILIIDDYTPLLEEVSEFLALEGYRVFTAKNGAEGVQKAITKKPDLILCDILMPELNGYETFEAISKIPNMSAIPFIFITARATPDDYKKGLELGVDDYLTKPFTMTEIISSIEKRFEKIKQYQANKDNIIDFFFSNSLLAIFIVSDTKFLFINNKFQELTGYSLQELNKVEINEIIIGKIDESKRQFELLNAGVKKNITLQHGILKKDKSIVNVEASLSTILFRGKKSVIGCAFEKDENLTQPNLDLKNFMTFLNENNKNYISNEIENYYQQMAVEESLAQKNVKKNINLSKREKEVIKHICNGYTNKEIAEKLFISNRTVDNHRANILSKTHTKNSAELVAFIIKNRIIDI